jgi:hypothetical protein
MYYRAFWQRSCRAAAAGAVLKPSGGNCAVLPLFFSIFIVKKAPPDEKSGGAFFAYQVINVRAFPQHVTPFFPLFHAQTSFSTPSRTAFQSTA